MCACVCGWVEATADLCRNVQLHAVHAVHALQPSPATPADPVGIPPPPRPFVTGAVAWPPPSLAPTWLPRLRLMHTPAACCCRRPCAAVLLAWLMGLAYFLLTASAGGVTTLQLNPAADLGGRICHALLPIPNKVGAGGSRLALSHAIVHLPRPAADF